jgi:glycosyltransferase involved in cell wall biosynthesis
MFSVVMPVRDKPHTIARTLESALAQSFADFELILVGDPADAGLGAAADHPDPRIRIVHHPVSGQGAARNAGIAAGRADWIAFLDADDLWLPDHLAELDSVRRAHPGAGLIGTNFIDSDWDAPLALPADRGSGIASIDYFDSIGTGANILFTSSAAIPRGTCDRLGGFGNTRFGEDTEYWARIAFAFPVAVSRRITSVYVHGTGGITDSGRARWAGELTCARDISPAIALAIDRHPSIDSPALRRGVESYIRRYQDWCLRTSIAVGDIATVRRLRRIYWGRPSAGHIVLLAIGALPAPLARAAYGLGFRLKALLRRARRGLARGRGTAL